MSSISRRPAAPPRVICRPAGPGGADVYATFRDAVIAARLAGPGTVLYIDGDTTVEAIAHDITGIDKIVGLGTITPTLTYADGATLTDDYNDIEFENVAIVFGGATAVISVDFATITLGRYTSIACTITATAGFIEATSSIGVDMDHDTSLIGGSGHQVIKLGASAGARIRVGNGGSIATNTITGGADGGVEITDVSKSGGAAASIGSQAGLTNATYD